jgi:outer membrane protein TolC
MRIFLGCGLLAGLAWAQGPALPPGPSTVPARLPSVSPSSSSQFQGSVAEGEAGAPLKLSLQDAIDRGLKTNLGLLVRDTGVSTARAERIRALSDLLPKVAGDISETLQQINLAAFGFHFPGVSPIIGPFGLFDARASASQTIYDRTALKNKKAAELNEQAAVLSYKDGRDLVVQAVASSYLQIISDAARVDATRVQVATAQALYERARDQHRAGTSPAIDELRSQVELKTLQQQLLAQDNQLSKSKLSLARVIGLPSGQSFGLSDTAPFAALEGVTVEQAMRRALETRADYQSAMMQVRAAETAREAAVGQRYPSLGVAANYGDIGPNIGNSHGTFALTGSLKFNIFDGGRIKADVLEADAAIKQRKDELADLRGQIDFQIRTALLDLKSAADQVDVARGNLDLANQTLTQARDRFAAGVTDNIEVVQAQESVASANQNLINAVYAHNLAKVALSRAVGGAETSLKEFMGGSK